MRFQRTSDGPQGATALPGGRRRFRYRNGGDECGGVKADGWIGFDLTSWLLLPVVLAVGGCMTPPSADCPLAGQAYSGLRVRDVPGVYGAVIGWVLPGPLAPDGQAALSRGDILLGVNGAPVADAASFRRMVADAAPGDRFLLHVRRTGGRPGSSLPTPGASSEEIELPLVLAAKAEWAGPVAFPEPPARSWPGLLPPDVTTPFERRLHAQQAAHGLTEPYERLVNLLTATRDRRGGANTLQRIDYAFRHPARILELERRVTDPLLSLAVEPERFWAQAALNLEVEAPRSGPGWHGASPHALLRDVAKSLVEAQAHLEQALEKLTPAERHTLAADGKALCDTFARWGMQRHSDPRRLVRTLQLSRRVNVAALLAAGAALNGAFGDLPDFRDAPLLPPPPGVEGEVIAVLEHRGFTLVIGGPGPNRYDLARIDAVIDVGGDDEYVFAERPAGSVQVIVDRGGNDVYRAGTGQPGAAFGGVQVIVDHGGDDRYTGGDFSLASAFLGVALLVNKAGNNHYASGRWSQGAAVYGAAGLLDLGGDDVYELAAMGQGLGGPRGFGLLLDAAGDDLYRATGVIPSVYGDKDHWFGLAQGVGFGFRHYDTGGIGVLLDLAGDDTYIAGEFSQGGGYYWGLGILRDVDGNDTYTGGRYSQGFGCHQAVGILADDAGNDRYHGLRVAHQGFAWDLAVGLLIDRGGDDQYEAPNAAQGNAAMQSIAFLVDLGGDDVYQCGGRHTQGQSWGNSYHYHATGCMSFSLLLDAGGGDDTYSSGRPNNTILATGSWDEEKPENSSLYGLFMDLPQEPSFEDGFPE